MPQKADIAVIVPYRDRGTDPLRGANLGYILWHWSLYTAPFAVVNDGRTGNTQFNRSAAYNRAIKEHPDTNIFIFTESDMLIHYDLIDEAVALAAEQPGLVVPFTRQLKLSETDSDLVRDHKKAPPKCEPAQRFTNNYGCINIVSRATLNLIGQWDEQFEGNAHDDAAMWIAFDIAAGPTRWVDGDAYHLYHQEAIRSDAPADDKTATSHNYRRMQLYLQARTPEEIRHLTAGGKTLQRNWKGQLC